MSDVKVPFLRVEMVYFAGCDCPEHIEEAKKYIKRMGFSQDDVKLVRRKYDDRDGEILVVGKRTAWTQHDKERA